ncbi:MAG: acyl carrier protein [Bacteroidales bacterium]|jgi:acyl carrier protein|nr:acyl carrier protein [Bacteroidales bacterium]
MSEIYQRITKVVVDKLGVDKNEVVPTASFTTDLGADSLDSIELIMELEKEFDIQINDSEVENLDTVEKVAKFVEKQLEDKKV